MGASDVNPEARREMVTKKAHELYVKRGGNPGHELDDWLEAEKMVDRELQGTRVPPQTRPTGDQQTAFNPKGRSGVKRVFG